MLKAEISKRYDGEERDVRDGDDDDGRVRWKWRWWRESEERNSPSPEIIYIERVSVTAKCLIFVSRSLCFCRRRDLDQ